MRRRGRRRCAGRPGRCCRMAAYLTGSIEMFWKMGVAIGDFAKGFVFSPRVWSGIALAGVAVVLFMVSGPLRRRSVKPGQDKPGRRARVQRGRGRDRQLADRGRTTGHPPGRPSPRQGPGQGAQGQERRR